MEKDWVVGTTVLPIYGGLGGYNADAVATVFKLARQLDSHRYLFQIGPRVGD